jgi:hypothetical protein
MARAKKADLVAEPAATEVVGPSLDDKLRAIGAVVEMIAYGNTGPQDLRQAATALSILLKS